MTRPLHEVYLSFVYEENITHLNKAMYVFLLMSFPNL